MEKYDVVNMKELERADYFYYFMSVGTTIEFTVKLDVTAAIGRCREETINFQAFMLFRIYKVINTIENFRYDILDGKLIRWERIVPTFSSFNKSSKLFFTLYADMTENERSFDACYKKVVREYADCSTIVPQGNLPANIFNVSCIPWLHFEHFSSNSKTKENNLVKMITIGKYEKVNGRFILPFTMQVSHAIADGYHVSLFFERLQEELNMV